MDKLATSLTIIRHAFGVMWRNPTLLVFPLFGLLAGIGVYVFFLAPLLFDTTMAEIWYMLQLPGESWDVIAPWRAAEEGAGNLGRDHWLGYAAYYLLAMFMTTFFNVALYSQIIEALNGGRVSVARGISVACGRLGAIVAWTVLASSVGLVLRVVQDRVGPVGKWIAGLAGISWSAASVFVIPVIINEPRPRHPFHYVRTSTALAKRVWGEGILGIGSMALVFVLVVVLMAVLSLSLSSISGDHYLQVATCISLAGVALFMALYLAWQIFECGMYVYATEGVAPGTFNEEMFDRVWIFKGAAAASDEPQPARSVPWSKLWRVLPLAGAGVGIWLHFFPPSFTGQDDPVWHPEAYIGHMTIDLAELAYKVRIEDLQAAGLFTGDKAPAAGFFSQGSSDKFFTGTYDSGLQPQMFKRKNGLIVHFYGKDRQVGKVRMMRAAELLQVRFPGHEQAIVAEPFIPPPPRKFVITWPAVEGAATYALEIDCSRCGFGGTKSKIVTDLHSTTYTHTVDWAAAQPTRVRVWGVNSEGRRGFKSPWTQFEFSR